MNLVLVTARVAKSGNTVIYDSWLGASPTRAATSLSEDVTDTTPERTAIKGFETAFRIRQPRRLICAEKARSFWRSLLPETACYRRSQPNANR